MLLVVTLGALIGCFIGISWFAGTDAPYVATKSARVKKALTLVGLKKDEVFYELGSGDGRVVLEAAKLGAKAFGIEQSWIRVLWSRYSARKLNLPNAKFIHGNIFSYLSSSRKRGSINNIDIIFIFLLPKGVAKLEPILRSNLKKGSRVMTQTFHFPKWKPYKKVLLTDKNVPNTPLGKNIVEGDFWYYRV